MFGPNAADKYALALDKSLILGCDSWPRRALQATYFLITNPSSMVQRMHAGLATRKSQVRTWSEAPNIILFLKKKHIQVTFINLNMQIQFSRPAL